jgi:RNA polymerase sigma-70 factor (ECF subfamily)
MTGDFEIIRRIRKGDVGQFESLFRSSYASLVRYAKTLIRDHDTAEEIVQDLFFRLWRDKENLNIESSLNGYLYRSVIIAAYIISITTGLWKVCQGMAVMAGTMKPTDILHYRELQAKIAAILERLPEKCGKIFCMSRFEGLKYSEIAEKLSISVKTVEANMGRALKEFRKILAEQ